ncbi:MAG TPA: TPM domain-containing protein [Planctomycetota bacterium]|nr:TPM domain-containing protein [Planctomycetota bacterium]
MRFPTKWRSSSSWAAALLAALAAAGCVADRPTGAPPQTRVQKDYSPFPNPDAGYVTDLAGLLTANEEERIERWLWEAESRTGVEIVIVTLGSIRDYPGTPNQSIEAFARGLFDAYGIGNMPANKGVLLLVARNDRKVRIELGAGYGRARDADAARIVNDVIVPSFKRDDYAGGITEGARAILREFAGVRISWNWTLIGLLVAIPVVGLIAYSLFRSGKRGWGWMAVGLLIMLVLAAITLIISILRHASRGRSSGWSSGGFGGGFGGGFSGGGGATGSW